MARLFCHVSHCPIPIHGCGKVVPTHALKGCLPRRLNWHDSARRDSPTRGMIAPYSPTDLTLPASGGGLANPSVLDQQVTFTATVSVNTSGSELLGGTVKFLEGATLLGTATLDASGHATFTTTTLSAGAHYVKTVYAGNAQ